MSWSDLFFPGNPERRERLIRKNQELIELMKNNFRATNQLIETLNKHLHMSFSPIALDEKATVKENCDVITKRIHEIQAEVEKIDTHLKEQLEPALYEKLLKSSLTVPDLNHVSVILTRFFCSAASISAIGIDVFCWLIKNGKILKNITLAISKIGIAVIGGVVFGVLLVIGMVVEVFLGMKERDQLESALGEYEKVLKEFRPASEEYQDSITYVRIKIEERIKGK